MVWFGWTSTCFNEAGRKLTNLYCVTVAYQMHLCGSFDLSDTITSCYQAEWACYLHSWQIRHFGRKRFNPVKQCQAIISLSESHLLNKVYFVFKLHYKTQRD